MVQTIGRIIITWAIDILYLVVYILTLGTVTISEATYFRLINLYVNWNIDYYTHPGQYETPSTETEIVNLVKNAPRIRVHGAGHSFNTGTITDGMLINLDNYSNIIQIDHEKLTVRVQAGIRLRDFMSKIEAEGLSLPTLGSTNAQSLGGLIATDLHGTAKEQAFLSDRIIWLKIVDANGIVHKLHKDENPEELFAVAGAIGALGIVIEVQLQCVRLYRQEKRITIVPIKPTVNNIEEYLANNDHLSFYFIGGTTVQSCRMNTWNETVKPKSPFYSWRHFYQEIVDFIQCSFTLGIGRVTQKLDILAPLGLLFMAIFMNRGLVSNASNSFSRQLFYRHDEIEYGIPMEHFSEALKRLLDLLASNPKYYVCVVEVRFADYDGGSKSLLGPGAGRRTVFLELAPSLSQDPTDLFTDAEKLFKEYGGFPHLGKWTTATPEYMREVHGAERFDKFQELRKKYDPSGKFANAFINQVFGPMAGSSTKPLVSGPAKPLFSIPNNIASSSASSHPINEADED